jgi:UDP-N-acetylmuramoyl-tripeptide--D-alanyl-D-alanine ligase
LYWFWHTPQYETEVENLTETQRSAAVFLGLAMLLQLAVGVGLLIDWARFGTTGTWEFGLALVLSYPLVWATVLSVLAGTFSLLRMLWHPKKAGRAFVCTMLEWQVRQLRVRHHFKVVAVAGSVGKTSTKTAIAELLGQNKRVRWQKGNYNDRVTVPLVFFGVKEPSLFNIFAWIKVFGITQSEIAMPYPFDIVVVELGTDGPGQLADFAYLKPDLTVITAIVPEHMEYFGTLDAVAKEELAVFDYSKKVLVNGDDIAAEYLAGREFLEYSLTSEQAQYRAVRTHKNSADGQTLDLVLSRGKTAQASVQFLGEQGAKIVLAAAAVADMLGVSKAEITKGLPELRPFSGRMQLLPGVKSSRLIDDTYNSSPIATNAALDVLYSSRSEQRIAILGSMNELGAYSKAAHHEVGEHCDPKKLDVVVTIGTDAKKWLAPAARAAGCTVHTFMNPYDAGEYVANKLRKGSVVLAKGSQNGVFAEEALKVLLENPADADKLVRQTVHWMTRKAKQFGPPPSLLS